MWQQVQQGVQVEVWTFATLDPDAASLSPYAKALHERWKITKNPSHMRREEDKQALSGLGCGWIHLDYPDCIYRFNPLTNEPLIQKDEDLFSSDIQVDLPLVNNMLLSLKEKIGAQRVQNQKNGLADPELEFFVPLAVGGHIDHRNTRLAAEKLELPLFYYADLPYAAMNPELVEASLPKGTLPIRYEITAAGIKAWQNSIACYTSQISSFWSSLEEMKAALVDYSNQPLACMFWKKSYRKNNNRSKHGKA